MFSANDTIWLNLMFEKLLTVAQSVLFQRVVSFCSVIHEHLITLLSDLGDVKYLDARYYIN